MRSGRIPSGSASSMARVLSCRRRFSKPTPPTVSHGRAAEVPTTFCSRHAISRCRAASATARGGSVARPGLDVERRVVALAGGPRDVDVDAESRVRAVVAARAEHGFDLERVAAAQRHLQDILERLHGRDLVRPRPTLVVEVVGGDGVVRRGDARETSLALRLLLGRVLVGVPSEAQLAVRRLDTIQIAAVLVRNLEHDVRLVDRQGAARHGRSPASPEEDITPTRAEPR